MRIEIVRSSNGDARLQFQITYLVNDVVAIDAGCLGIAPLETQHRVEHVFLTHAHMDHVASLPIFIDNVYRPGPQSVTVYGNAETIASLQQDMFNDRLWPDVLRLSRDESPFVRFQTLTMESAVEVGDLSLKPVALNHVVPTCGFLISERRGATVAIVSDTGPTDRIWQLGAAAGLDAVLLDSSFPNNMRWLADKSLHLCPETFAAELAKLREPVRTMAIHLKPTYFDTIAAELQALKLPQLEIGEPGKRYEF